MLGSTTIRKLIVDNELVSGYIDLDTQLQPNGFDLTIKSIENFAGIGMISEEGKKLPKMEESIPNYPKSDTGAKNDAWILPKGVYLVHFNETVKLPKNIAALSIQRSTVFRCGNFMQVGSWDAGYNGNGIGLLVVGNSDGLVIERNSRVCQLHFFEVTGDNFGYSGNYQHENLVK